MGNYISVGNYWDYETSNETKQIYGWKADTFDIRDDLYNLTRTIHSKDEMSETVDLRSQCPVVYNQGNLGSCTANAIAGAYEFDELKQVNSDDFTPSRLFVYYNERDMEGHIGSDDGAEIRDGMKTINQLGVCPESMWPYDTNKFTDKPTEQCYTEAKNHLSIKYERLNQKLDEMKHCLNEGYPFVFGFVVYPSFEDPEVAKTGQMTMPKPDEKPIGGHAVMAVGYNDSHIIVRNSWGANWGDQGYFYMPTDYIKDLNLCSDFWTLRKVSAS